MVKAGAVNLDVLVLAVFKLENAVNSVSNITRCVPYLIAFLALEL